MQDKVRVEEVTGLREHGPLRKMVRSQPFWVAVALCAICLVMSWVEPKAFPTADNFFNITRNFAFIGIIALGMTAVIITGGIDLSVGSIMGLVGIVSGLLLQAEFPWWVALVAGLMTGMACGAINGALIAYFKLAPFVVTLGMLSIARSLAIVLSENKMIYEFGPDAEIIYSIGGGEFLGLANALWLLMFLTLGFIYAFNFTAWGRHIYAIGGNESAARLTGVPVDKMKVHVYMVSGLMAAVSGFMVVGWQGSAINALGTGYELRVIASTVIGGANLMGGEGGAFGAFIGAALIEVIRNSLLMAGVDSNWQGTFVGLFIILAVLLEKIRGNALGALGVFWGITGFMALLMFAVYRLAKFAYGGYIDPGFAWYHWALLLANTGFMAYYEGFKGFQRGYSPRLISRAKHLYEHPTLTRALLAPLFCMGFFAAPRRRVIGTCALTVGIIVLVILFQKLPQPWRAALDVGVVVGLSWGIIATVAIGVRVLLDPERAVDPQVPADGVEARGTA